MSGLTLLPVETKVGMGSKGLSSTYSFVVEEDDPNLSSFLRKLFKEVGSVSTFAQCWSLGLKGKAEFAGT